MTADDFKQALQKMAKPQDAQFLQRFFKTGKGQYGEGDVFIGVRVPATRAVCRQFGTLPLTEVSKLFDSPVHEHRLAAAIILSDQYKKSNPEQQAKIFNLYLKKLHSGRINNWDIVDSSAQFVVGPQVATAGDTRLLSDLARSQDIWQRRVSIIAAAHFLFQNNADPTLKIAEILVNDPHDLIQKAVGWQLREVGKRVDRQLLLAFLDKHAATMPRTALRYAIEHLPPQQRLHYMHLKNNTSNNLAN